jgi:hypothetical protein
VFVEKLKRFNEAEEHIKLVIREETEAEDIDIIVSILRSDLISPPLKSEQIGRLYNAYVAFNSAVENVDEELKHGAQLFSYLKQLMKLQMRQRDKAMMLNLIEEPVTLQLFRDLFTIFYEPLVRVYKSANIYNSITDFAVFVDDMIQVSRFSIIWNDTNHFARSWRNVGNKMLRQILTRPYKLSSTFVNGTNTTSTSSSMRSIRTITASSLSSWVGLRVSLSFSGRVPRLGRWI